MSKDIEEVMEVEDISFHDDVLTSGTTSKQNNGSTGWISASAAPAISSEGPQKKSLVVDITNSVSQLSRQRPESVNSFNSFDDSDTEVVEKERPYPVSVSIDIHELKKIFRDSITSPGAEHAQKQYVPNIILYFFLKYMRFIYLYMIR